MVCNNWSTTFVVTLIYLLLQCLMAKISKSITLLMDPDVVWAIVGDLERFAEWFPGMESSLVEGDIRISELGPLGTIRERILHHDDDERRYQYTAFETPIPMTHHLASFRVVATTEGSRVLWETEVEPASLVSIMEPAIENAINALKQHIVGYVAEFVPEHRT